MEKTQRGNLGEKNRLASSRGVHRKRETRKKEKKGLIYNLIRPESARCLGVRAALVL